MWNNGKDVGSAVAVRFGGLLRVVVLFLAVIVVRWSAYVLLIANWFAVAPATKVNCFSVLVGWSIHVCYALFARFGRFAYSALELYP